MLKISRIIMVAIVISLATFSTGFPDEDKTSRSYEDLLEIYMIRSELLPKARALESYLLAKAEDIEPINLWHSIRDLNKPAKIRAANGVALIHILFPGGKPGCWDEVSGFWSPQFISRPLAAFDAVYYTSIALLEFGDDAAPWLAQEFLDDLRGSSRAALLAMRTAPREYPELIFRLESRTGLTPIGGWPDAVISGILPFAHAASSFITQDHAIMLGMVFLNASGQPVSGTGPFAWDRKMGRVYRVVESLNDIEWWLIP